MWYPRAQGLGGSTTHNAYINQVCRCFSFYLLIFLKYHITKIPHKWDFDNIKTITGDASWDSATVMKYFTKIENNLYLPPDMGVPLGHGMRKILLAETQSEALLFRIQWLVEHSSATQ